MKRAGVQSLVVVVLLAGCRRHEDTGALIERLASPDESVRVDAAYQLARRGEVVVPDLLAALEDDRPLVRDWTIRTLGEMGREAEPAMPRISQALDDVDDDVRASAVIVLGNLRFDSVLPALIVKAKDPSPRVRALAVGTLGMHRNPETLPALGAAMRDLDEDVRVCALGALASFGGASSALLPDILAALDDGSPRVRAAAAGALGAMGPAARPALERLVRVLNEQDESQVQQAAIRAIANSGSEAVPLLVNALRNGARFARLAAADALGRAEAPAKDAIPALKAAIEEGDPLVAAAAEEAVRRIQGAIAAEEAEAREKAEAEEDR
jgi:HEAT repeat protein